MFNFIISVVRFIVVTVIIGSLIRIAMALLGIDKKLDGKNKSWDSYRKQEAKVIKVSGKCLRKAGEKIKELSAEVKEEVNNSPKVTEAVEDLKNVTSTIINAVKGKETPAYLSNGICEKPEGERCSIDYTCENCPFIAEKEEVTNG